VNWESFSKQQQSSKPPAVTPNALRSR